MLKKNLFRTQAGSNPVAMHQPALIKAGHALPPVPVFSETLLLLELEAQEYCADLRRLSRAVLSDLGATVQVLRLAGREYGSTEDRPRRIEDCISDLGLRSCLNSVGAQVVSKDSRADIAQLWAHSTEIAYHARLVAEEISGINPDEAYLVGLLHGIGMLPAVLAWDDREWYLQESAHSGLELALQWSLPAFVVDAFLEMSGAREAGRWTDILKIAHQRATAVTIDCPNQQEMGPLLLSRISSDFAMHGELVSV